MPFTPAHVAAVLPLVRRTTGRPGWTAALVAGSMAPDLPYFIPSRLLDLSPVPLDRESSHSLLAMVTTTALLGVVAALVWDRVAEPVARDLLPRRVAGRLRPPGPRVSWRDLPAVYLCAVGGIATHDAWDAFTHGTGPAVTRIGSLRAEVAGVPVWHLLQHVSTVTGLAVLAVWAWRRLAHRPAVDAPRRARWGPTALGLVVAAAVLAGLASAWPHRDTPSLVGWYGATRGGGMLALGAAAICLLWWVAVARRGDRSSA